MKHKRKTPFRWRRIDWLFPALDFEELRALWQQPPVPEKPDDAVILQLAKELGRAARNLRLIREEADLVRGLDEFDSRHCKWENRLFRSEQERDIAAERIRLASEIWVSKQEGSK